MGGYGQYYGGSLYALGLTRRTEDGIDRAAPLAAENRNETADVSTSIRDVNYRITDIQLRGVAQPGTQVGSGQV